MPRDPVNGIRDVRPDLAYPLAVYCHLFDCSIDTARRHIRAGKVTAIQRPTANGTRSMILGAELLRLYGEQALAAPAPTETKTERARRARRSLDRLRTLGVKC